MLTGELLRRLSTFDQLKIVIIKTKQGKTLHIRTMQRLKHETGPDNSVLTTFSGYAVSVSGVVSRLRRIKPEGQALVSYSQSQYWEIASITEDKASDMVTINLGRRVIDDSEIVHIR